MRQNFKLFCCAAYILNLIVSICLSCWPNLRCSGVLSTEFHSFRKNSAKPDISRKYGPASRICWKIRLRGLDIAFDMSTSICYPAHLAFNAPNGGVPWEDLRKILHGGQRMATKWSRNIAESSTHVLLSFFLDPAHKS